MATTLTNATLTVTITESITLNGVDQGGTQTLSVSNINEIDRRIFTAGTSAADIIGFGTSNGQGQFVRTDVKYIRITNLDDTNFVVIGMKDSASDTFYVKLDAGKSLMFGNDDLEIHASGGAWSAWSEADVITAAADTASVDLEVFIAST